MEEEVGCILISLSATKAQMCLD